MIKEIYIYIYAFFFFFNTARKYKNILSKKIGKNKVILNFNLLNKKDYMLILFIFIFKILNKKNIFLKNILKNKPKRKKKSNFKYTFHQDLT